MADRHPQLDVRVHLLLDFVNFLTIFFQRVDTVWDLTAHSMAVDGHLSAEHCLGVRADKAAAARTVAIVAQHNGTGPHFSALQNIQRALRCGARSHNKGIDHIKFLYI